MRNRAPFSAALGLFAAFLLGAADVTPGKLVSRWPIKTSLPANAQLGKPGVLIPLADFLALTAAADHATQEFEKTRYPKIAGSAAGEGDIVRTRGYMRVVAGEPDGDYHIQISETNDTFANSLVVEAPKDDSHFVENAPALVEAAKSVRSFIMSRITNNVDPLGHVLVIKGPAYVEITGQLFFDSEHQAAMGSGVFRGKSIGEGANRKQLPSKTSWEIHPVTGITFAPIPK